MSDEREVRTVHETTRSYDAGVIARFVLIAAIVVILVLVAFDNREDVRVGYVIGETKGPIWIVLVIAAAAGVIIGWLLSHRPRRSR